MCCWSIKLVTRNLEAASHVTSGRMLWQPLVLGNERQKGKMFTVPSAGRQEQWKEIYKAFSPAITCSYDADSSQLGYDSLHLADLRHGRNFLGSG
jgi:hypothetical protein